MKIENNSIIFNNKNISTRLIIGHDTYYTVYEQLKNALVYFEAPYNKKKGMLVVSDSFYGIVFADVILHFSELNILESVVIKPNWYALFEAFTFDDPITSIQNICEDKLARIFNLTNDNIAKYTESKIYLSNDLIIQSVLSHYDHDDYMVIVSKNIGDNNNG